MIILTVDGGGGDCSGRACYASAHVNGEVRRFDLDCHTSNEAEYLAVIRGLEWAVELGLREVLVRSDSMLVVWQVEGEWRIKAAHLRPLCDRVWELMDLFADVQLEWVPRKEIVPVLGH